MQAPSFEAALTLADEIVLCTNTQTDTLHGFALLTKMDKTKTVLSDSYFDAGRLKEVDRDNILNKIYINENELEYNTDDEKSITDYERDYGRRIVSNSIVKQLVRNNLVARVPRQRARERKAQLDGMMSDTQVWELMYICTRTSGYDEDELTANKMVDGGYKTGTRMLQEIIRMLDDESDPFKNILYIPALVPNDKRGDSASIFYNKLQDALNIERLNVNDANAGDTLSGTIRFYYWMRPQP
jgi:hypothetical protein